MKKTILLSLLAMAFSVQAFAFNPDPMKYEYIGQKQSDGNSIFYEIATARADGQKGVIVMLQADPKNRTLRYYRNVVIDPASMTLRGSSCDLYDYNGNLLESFSLPGEPVHYAAKSLEANIYKDLLDKGIVKAPKPVYVPRQVQPAASSGPNWKSGFSGGSEVIVDLSPEPNDVPIVDI